MNAIKQAGITETIVAKQNTNPKTWDLDLSLALRNVLMDEWNMT